MDSKEVKKMKKKKEKQNFVENAMSNPDKVREMIESKDGKYTVLGIDKFKDECWHMGEYSTEISALEAAEALTTGAMKDATDASVATVYYAYTPNGGYIGGDTWEKKK